MHTLKQQHKNIHIYANIWKFTLKWWSLPPAYQEGDSSVHVEVLEIEAEQAEATSERPNVCEVIINPEGQREDVGQVRQRQVDHEDHRLGVLTGGKEMQQCKACWRDWCGLVLVFLALPDVSAEDPEGSGVEQKPGDEDQKIEVSVHGLDILFPGGHVVATQRGGVGHRLRPLPGPSQSHVDWLRYPNSLKEAKEMTLNRRAAKEFFKKPKTTTKKTTTHRQPCWLWWLNLFSVQHVEIPCYDSNSATIFGCIDCFRFLLFSPLSCHVFASPSAQRGYLPTTTTLITVTGR